MVKAIYPKRQRYKSLHLFGHSKTGLKNFLISWAAFQIFPENLRLRSNAVLRRHELDLQQFESTLIVSSPVRSKPLLTRRNRTLKKKSQKLLLLNTAFDPVLKSLVRKFGWSRPRNPGPYLTRDCIWIRWGVFYGANSSREQRLSWSKSNQLCLSALMWLHRLKSQTWSQLSSAH